MKKVVSIMVVFALVFGLISAQVVSSAASETTYKTKNYISNFKISGRNISTADGIQLDWSGSSAEWNANCSGDVKVTFSGNNSMFTVYVDGVRKADKLVKNQTTQTFTILRRL